MGYSRTTSSLGLQSILSLVGTVFCGWIFIGCFYLCVLNMSEHLSWLRMPKSLLVFIIQKIFIECKGHFFGGDKFLEVDFLG